MVGESAIIRIVGSVATVIGVGRWFVRRRPVTAALVRESTPVPTISATCSADPPPRAGVLRRPPSRLPIAVKLPGVRDIYGRSFWAPDRPEGMRVNSAGREPWIRWQRSNGKPHRGGRKSCGRLSRLSPLRG